MKIINVEQNSQEWLEARKGRITGSKLGDIVVKRGTGRKIGFYELLADRLALEDGVEISDDPIERGHQLEGEALDIFEKQTGKKVERVGLCISDRNPNIALSPDGLVKSGDKYPEAIEVKCLSTPRHLMAYFEKEIPKDYEYQVLQYFIVNEDLEQLHFCFYDPRVTSMPFFFLTVKREEVQEQVEAMIQYQEQVLRDVEQLLVEISF